MINYIKIENKGLIEIEDLMLIGSSTKRGNDTKIGQFGSGWKFALAWILRNQLSIRIFSGLEEIITDFKIRLHRNNPVKVLTINGQETSITSGMGEIDWKGWMALREIVSNSIDEGDEKISTVFNPEIFSGKDGKTTIFIEMNGELADILRNYNDYFCFERIPYYQHEGFKLYKTDDAKESITFRKGIRCYEPSNITGFDFNFDNININESRLSDSYSFSNSFRNEFKKLTDSHVFLELLTRVPISTLPQTLSGDNLETMKELVKYHKFKPAALKSLAGMLIPGIAIPNEWYTKLRDTGLIDDVFEEMFGKKSTSGDFYIIEELHLKNEQISYEISDVIPMKVVFVKFIDNSKIAYLNETFYVTDEYVNKDADEIFSEIFYSLSKANIKSYFNSLKQKA